MMTFVVSGDSKSIQVSTADCCTVATYVGDDADGKDTKTDDDGEIRPQTNSTLGGYPYVDQVP